MADQQDEPTDTTGSARADGPDAAEPEAYPTDDATRPGTGRSRAPWFAAVAGLVVVALVGGAVLVGDGDDGGPPVLSVTPGGTFEAAGDAVADMGMSSSSMVADIEYVLDGDLPDLGDTGTAYRLVRPDLSDEDVLRLAAALGVDGSIQRTDGSRVVSDGDRTVQVGDAVENGWYVSSYQGYSTGDAVVSSDGATTATTTANGADLSDGGAPVPDDPPAPPTDLPSEAEAEDIARGVLDAAGVDGEWTATVADGMSLGSAYECDASGLCSEPDTVLQSRSVTLMLLVDGVPSEVSWSFEIGDQGEIAWASGTLVDVEEVGEYPLRSTADVYDDLVAGDAWYGGPMMGYAAGSMEKFTTVGSAISADSGGGSAGSTGSEGCTPEECGVATSTPVPMVECVAPATDGCGNVAVCEGDPVAPPTNVPGTEPAAGPASDPAITGSTVCSVGDPVPVPDELPTVEPVPMPEPEPVPALVVHVSGAERSLVQVPGVADGAATTWLLPAYRFLGTWESGDDWFADLPAVDEAYLDLPDPEAPATTVPDDGSTDATAAPASTTTVPTDTTGSPEPPVTVTVTTSPTPTTSAPVTTTFPASPDEPVTAPSTPTTAG